MIDSHDFGKLDWVGSPNSSFIFLRLRGGWSPVALSAVTLRRLIDLPKLKIIFVHMNTLMSSPRPSLTLSLLQGREAAMAFFRPSLNARELTEQQWRIIRILRQKGELEIHRLAKFACILKPSMSGVLARMERGGFVRRWRSADDQRRIFVGLTDQGQQRFIEMAGDMEQNYRRLVDQFGEDKLGQLLKLLDELKAVAP
jgi:homoprotocatechuate degradation regulator HpaR